MSLFSQLNRQIFVKFGHDLKEEVSRFRCIFVSIYCPTLSKYNCYQLRPQQDLGHSVNKNTDSFGVCLLSTYSLLLFDSRLLYHIALFFAHRWLNWGTWPNLMQLCLNKLSFMKVIMSIFNPFGEPSKTDMEWHFKSDGKR